MTKKRGSLGRGLSAILGNHSRNITADITENIPTELVVDLDNLDIGSSIKISSIKLPENVTPTIQGRDFVVATVAAPTIIKEPEKPAEETTEEGAELAAEGTEGEVKTAEGDDKKEGDKKEGDKGDKKEGDKKEGDKTKKSPVEKK